MLEKENVLIIGSGAREHAFAYSFKKSALLNKLFIAPGNAGTGLIGTNIPLDETDFTSIKKIVIENEISVVVVGTEVPLVLGIKDFFDEDESLKNVLVIGPNKAGAELEGSKDFSKKFMKQHSIPTATYQSFTKDNFESGQKYLESLPPPYVLKASGLASGKGVLIIDNLKEAKKKLDEMLNGMFGNASETVVIEEFLQGIEISFFVLTDGSSYMILPSAKDYKRIGYNDTGLNTGGMGAVSPVPFADNVFLKNVEEKIVKPTILGLKKEKIDYRGFLFFGLMINQDVVKVIEYNCRMGDPESEVVFPRIESDFLQHLVSLKQQKLHIEKISISPETAVAVVLASGGYPNEYKKGFEIKIKDGKKLKSIIFHAGTKKVGNKVVTNGGRVLAVTSLGNSIIDAASESYTTIRNIQFENSYCRLDIGNDLI